MVRCGTKKYIFSNGKYHYSNSSYGVYDYHFMVQTSDGRWSEKHGQGGKSILHNAGENPDNLSWDLGNLSGYYDSFVYLAVSG